MVLLFSIALLLFILSYRYFSFPRQVEYKQKHVVVIGGSEGIGNEVALRFLREDAKVTIVSRSIEKLKLAVTRLLAASKANEENCNYYSMDVTDERSVINGFQYIVSQLGRIDVLIISAGRAFPGYILEQKVDIFSKTVDLNYLGSVRCVKTALPYLLEDKSMNEKAEKQICFIGSACSVVSFLGYGSYAPSKFAVKGFADALRNELVGSGISISFAFPPDTNTPGFEKENIAKPKENIDMFPPAIYSAQIVADYIFDGMSRKEYVLLSPDIGQNLLVASMSSLTTRNRWAPLFILLSPIIHLVMLGLRMNCDRIAKPYGRQILLDLAKKK